MIRDRIESLVDVGIRIDAERFLEIRPGIMCQRWPLTVLM